MRRGPRAVFGLLVLLASVASAPAANPAYRPVQLLQLSRDVSLMKGRLLLGRPGDAFIESAVFPPRAPGFFDIVIHGNAQTVSIKRDDGSWQDLSPKDLVARLRSSGGWDGKQPVRLISCHVAAGYDSFAQQFANELGVPVHAPTDYISLTPGAKHFGIGHAPTAAMRMKDLRVLEPR